jgi:hypothetical protein
MLTTHPLLVPRLRKSGSYTSCHPNAPLWSVTGPLYLFLTFTLARERIYTSKAVSYSTSSSYVLWRIMYAWYGIPLPAAVPRSCRSYIPANVSCYIGNRQIHKDFRIPVFAKHVRSLTESLGSKMVDAWNSLFLQIGRFMASSYQERICNSFHYCSRL